MSDADTTPPRPEFVRELGYLTICSARDRDAHTLGLTGELDLANAAEVEEELRRIEATGVPRIVLDLTGLGFIDSTGIRLVLAADLRSRADTNRLVLTRPPANVLRAFAIAGVVDRLPFAD
jgi:anti-sigma B factor antagonist